MTRAHFRDILGARQGRNGRSVDVIGYNRASADIVDKFALYDKASFEIGAVPRCAKIGISRR